MYRKTKYTGGRPRRLSKNSASTSNSESGKLLARETQVCVLKEGTRAGEFGTVLNDEDIGVCRKRWILMMFYHISPF